MFQNPAIAQALVEDRVAQLRHSAGAGTHRRTDSGRHRVTETALRATGWLLVDVGLRLVVPRGGLHRPPVGRARLGVSHRSRSG